MAPRKEGNMPTQVEDMDTEADKLHKETYGGGEQEVTEDDDFGYINFDEDTTDIQPTQPEDDGFKHKYDVLKGKYDTEGGRMNEMLSTAMAENERLKLALGVPATKTADDHFSGDTDEITTLKKEYPSLAKGIEALAKKVVAESVSDTHQMINQSRRETFVSKVDDSIENWRQVNDDPDFIQWLQTRDKYTGASKHQLLKSAWDNYNVDSMKAFFDDFKSEKGTMSTTKNETTFDLSPDTSGGTMPSKSTKGFISKDEISTFYRDRAMNRFAGSEADAEKIEAKIMRAVKEGKVR